MARAELRLEVVRAYWALVTATESARVLEEALTRADAHLRDVRSRFDNGLVPPNDVASVEAQRARQQMHLIEARNLRGSVLEDLRRLTGITTDITTETFRKVLAVSTAVRHHCSTLRPEQEALRARVAAAQARVVAVQRGRKPMVTVNAG